MNMTNNVLGFLMICLLAVHNCQEISSSLSELASLKPLPTRYTVKLGDTIDLPCEIQNRRTATVIWQFSKSRIPETLTIGYFYYRKDFRIRVIANTTQEKEQAWNLEIRKVKLEDEGYYLCKVMAEPESLKRTIFLKVVVDMSVEPQNPIVSWNRPVSLFCNTSFIKDKSELTAYRTFKRNLNHARVIWFKDGMRIHSNGHYGKKNHSNGETPNMTIHHYSNPTVSSKLRIHHLSPETIGTYTCKFRYQNVSTIVADRDSNARNLELLRMNSVGSFHCPSQLLLSFLLAVFVFHYYH